MKPKTIIAVILILALSPTVSADDDTLRVSFKLEAGDIITGVSESLYYGAKDEYGQNWIGSSFWDGSRQDTLATDSIYVVSMSKADWLEHHNTSGRYVYFVTLYLDSGEELIRKKTFHYWSEEPSKSYYSGER